MISNERQYRITKAHAEKFSRALQEAAARNGVDPLLQKLELDALRSQLRDLEQELREYEMLRSGVESVLTLDSFAELPGADQGPRRFRTDAKRPGGAAWAERATNPTLRGNGLHGGKRAEVETSYRGARHPRPCRCFSRRAQGGQMTISAAFLAVTVMGGAPWPGKWYVARIRPERQLVQTEESRQIRRAVEHNNLDAILAVGYQNRRCNPPMSGN